MSRLQCDYHRSINAPPSQVSQSQEERANCLAGKATYRASLRSRLKNAQRSRMSKGIFAQPSTQGYRPLCLLTATAVCAKSAEVTPLRRSVHNDTNAATTARSRTVETFNRRRVRQSNDATATASARSAETLLRRTVRNARNAVTNARSRAAETFVRWRARQSSDAAATTRSMESETEQQQATCNSRNAAVTSDAGNSKGLKTRARRISTAATIIAAVRLFQILQARHLRLDGVIQRRPLYYLPSSSFWFSLAFNYDPVINLTVCVDINVGYMNCVRQFCNARIWAGEPAGLCCSSVRLPHLRTVPLKGLKAGFHPDSIHCLKTVREYNFFEMTSFGAQLFREQSWMPTFKVQGQVYHRIGSLLPEETSTLKFLQLYFIADYSLQAKFVFCRRREVLRTRTSCYYFRPCFTRLTATFAVSNMLWKRLRFLPSALGGAVHRISETHQSYDAMQYPLLFPYGDDGYYFGILLHTPGGQPTTPSKALLCKAFHSYRFMDRDGEFNLLHMCSHRRHLCHHHDQSERTCFFLWLLLHGGSLFRHSLRRNMAHNQALVPLNKSLRVIRDSTDLMDGLALLLSSDIRLTLSVIAKGTRRRVANTYREASST
ncbi:unnamed protein product [Acanthosepion pharaonis]|uniref:Uncharacterized protein n=1 Tax=Acanthosepion pharaonis TaxID=158019 RepID=A0A812C460_ACAPH|nr:unnamed protein product [Sepia pharaonis]